MYMYNVLVSVTTAIRVRPSLCFSRQLQVTTQIVNRLATVQLQTGRPSFPFKAKLTCIFDAHATVRVDSRWIVAFRLSVSHTLAEDSSQLLRRSRRNKIS